MSAFGWDAEVETVDSSFTLLPEGEYEFVVKDFERGRTKGTAKMPACDQAVYTLHMLNPGGLSANLRHYLPLDDSMRWKITQFFKGIGLIDGNLPEGTKVRFPWDNAVGCKGRAEVGVRTWTGDDGKERESNEIRCVMPSAGAQDYGSL